MGLTTLGIFHTGVALLALGFGVAALVRYKEISPRNFTGETYLVTTAISAATGLGIFQHGGFGPPHVLSLLTLAALALGTVAALTRLFGKWSRELQAVCYSTTIFFHLIPGVTETTTRLPVGAPLLASAEAPELKAVAGALVLLLVAGLFLQLRWFRRGGASA